MMSRRALRLLKAVVFCACLLPFFYIAYTFQTHRLGDDPVEALTHFTGHWAMYTLLASLSITPLRRLSLNLGWLVRFRRMIGLFAFFYATLHLMIYLFLASGFNLMDATASLQHFDLAAVKADWLAAWPTLWADVNKRRFVQVGFVAWCVLLALALTSPQWALRRMGGRAWQTLHRTVYGAAVLAVVHYWWATKHGVMAPLLVTLVLAVLLVARLLWTFSKRQNAT